MDNDYLSLVPKAKPQAEENDYLTLAPKKADFSDVRGGVKQQGVSYVSGKDVPLLDSPVDLRQQFESRLASRENYNAPGQGGARDYENDARDYLMTKAREALDSGVPVDQVKHILSTFDYSKGIPSNPFPAAPAPARVGWHDAVDVAGFPGKNPNASGNGSQAHPYIALRPDLFDKAYAAAPHGAFLMDQSGKLVQRVPSLGERAAMMFSQIPSRGIDLGKDALRALDTLVVHPAEQGAHTIAENFGAVHETDAPRQITAALDAAKYLDGQRSAGTKFGDIVADLKGRGLDPGFDAVKKHPLSMDTAQFISNQLAGSLPDLGALAVPEAYVPTLMQESGDVRAKNDGRDTATSDDLIAALPSSLAQLGLEKFGLHVGLPGGVVGRNALSRIGKAVVADAGSEGLENLSQYLGETVGTDKGPDTQEGLDQFLAGSLVGAPMGGALRTGTEIASGGRDTSTEGLKFTALDPKASHGDRLAAMLELSQRGEKVEIPDQAKNKAPAAIPSADATIAAATPPAATPAPVAAPALAPESMAKLGDVLANAMPKPIESAPAQPAPVHPIDAALSALQRAKEMPAPAPVAAPVPTERAAPPSPAVEAQPVAEKPAAAPLDPQERATADFERRLEALKQSGVPAEHVATIREQMHQPLTRDRVTGLYLSEELRPTLEAAHASGKPAVYVESDLANLNGLNAELGSSGADVHLKRLGEVVNEELSKVGQTVTIRKGGDEVGSVVVGASKEAVDAAMARARARFADEVAHLSHIPHTKEGREGGTAIHYGTAELLPGEAISDTVKAADTLVEARKRGAGYGIDRPTETAGAGSSSGGGTVAGAGTANRAGRGAGEGTESQGAPSAEPSTPVERVAEKQVTPATEKAPANVPAADQAAESASVAQEPSTVATKPEPVVRPEQGAGDLLAGDRPEQAGIESQPAGQQQGPVAEDNHSDLKTAADESRAELNKMLGRLNSGVDPTALYHLGRIGAYHIANGAAKLSDWLGRMKTYLGNKIFGLVESALPKVFRTTKADARESSADLPQKTDTLPSRRPGESQADYTRRVLNTSKGAIKAALEEGKRQQKIGRGTFRAMLAQRDRAIAQVDQAFAQVRKHFDKQGDAANLASIDQWENGEAVTDPNGRAFFNAIKEAFDHRVARIQAIDPKALESVIENYFPHIWEDTSKAVKWYQGFMAKRPLEGNKSFLKQRTWGTIKEGMASGLKPVTTNPVDLALLKIEQMDKFIALREFKADLDRRGWVKKIPAGERVPPGYAIVDDPAFKTSHAFVVKGENGAEEAATSRYNHVVPELLAKDINNYLAPSLYRFGAWKVLRSFENTLMSARLGWSMFHAGFTTTDNLIMHADVTGRQFLNGDIGGALRTMVKTPFTVLLSPLEGHALNKQWLGQSVADPHTEAVLHALEQGGARWKMSPTEYNNSLPKIIRAIRKGEAKGTLKELLPAVGEASSWIIHHWLVPNQKMAARVMLMKFELDRVAQKLGKERGDYAGITQAMHPDALRQIAGGVVDVVDDRLGQMTYDNQFWNKTAREVAQSMIGAVGWQVGTLRTVTGGVADLKHLWKPETLLSSLDKEGKITDANMGRVSGRLTYLLTLALTMGGLGAITQLLMTGKGPDEPKDYFFPKTGRKNDDGTDERLQYPSYWMDHYKLATHPLQTAEHKIHPAIGMMIEAINNKDYFGTKVRDEDAPWLDQAKQVGEYVAKGFLPYTWTNQTKLNESESGTGRKVANFFGVTQAPASVSRTEFQQFVYDKAYEKVPGGGRTAEIARLAKDRKDAAAAIRRGEHPDLSEFNPKAQKKIASDALLPVPALKFKSLSLPDKFRAYDMATPSERKEYSLDAIILHTRWDSAIRDLPGSAQQPAIDRVRKLVEQSGGEDAPKLRAKLEKLDADVGDSP